MSELLRTAVGPVPAAALSLVVATGTAVIVATTPSPHGLAAGRLELLGLLLLAGGVVVGSQRLVAVAAAPALIGAVVASVDAGTVTWGRSLVVGCGWFVAVELGLAVIDQHDSGSWSSGVARQRAREMAVIVALTVVVGGAGAMAARLAPERTLLIQAVVLAAVTSGLVATAGYLGRLGRDGSSTGGD